MLWNIKDLRVFLDVSTYCNAGCPQCHRTNPNGLGKADWLPLIRWDLKTFQKAFPKEELENIYVMKFCGTWGDPVMCKELYEMCEYIIQNSDCRIEMDTNGSIRDTDWWWNLGVLCGDRLMVVFDVDGINQKMHEKYRRFTHLNKVLENMEALSYTKARAQSQTILFKHNQEYKNEIIKLVKDYGSVKHSFVISDRFEAHQTVDGDKRFFIDENGEEDYLQRADPETLPDGVINGIGERVPSYEIKCRWGLPRNEIVVNPDGQIMPCCYHANAYYHGNFTDRGKAVWSHKIYTEEYSQNLKKYNILHTPLSNIIQSEWYQKILPNSIKGNNPVPQCARYCSNREKLQHQLRYAHET